MARIPAAVIIEPKNWERVRVYCFKNRKKIGRFLAESAIAQIDRDSKKGVGR